MVYGSFRPEIKEISLYSKSNYSKFDQTYRKNKNILWYQMGIIKFNLKYIKLFLWGSRCLNANIFIFIKLNQI